MPLLKLILLILGLTNSTPIPPHIDPIIYDICHRECKFEYFANNGYNTSKSIILYPMSHEYKKCVDECMQSFKLE